LFTAKNVEKNEIRIPVIIIPPVNIEITYKSAKNPISGSSSAKKYNIVINIPLANIPA
jgi:hypothetical protein